MFTQMAERQADVVDALLDTIPRDDWTHAYVHAEFRDEPGFLVHIEDGFLVVREDGRAGRASLLVETEVGQALQAMYETYAEAGHDFSRLDLLVHNGGSYRFDLDNTPSLILDEKPDPDARTRLDRRFEELVRDEGL
jgi:hypothetical protein